MIALFSMSSCRTAFPEAQTPDDVYYSPEGMRYDEERTQTDEDRYLRMKVRNRYEWAELNDWYTYERYNYGLNYAYGPPYHPYYNWNVYHNPYWLAPTGQTAPNRPRISNLNSYTPTDFTNNPKPNPVNPKLTGYGTNPSGNVGTNGGSTIGSGLRDLFNSGTRNAGSNNPVSMGNNSPAPSSSSSSSQPAPVRKF